MSDGANGGSLKPGPSVGGALEEVHGIFPSDAALQDAISRLTQAGWDRADLSLPQAVLDPATATPEQSAANPNTETDQRQMRTLHASMAGSVGAMAAAGVVIATGGAALPAVAAAAAAGVGAGGLTEVLTNASGSAEHQQREAQARAGTLVLSARANTPEQQREAEALMNQAGATSVAAVRRETAAVAEVHRPG